MRSSKRYIYCILLLFSLLFVAGCTEDTALRYGVDVLPLDNSYVNISKALTNSVSGLVFEETVIDEIAKSGYVSGRIINESYTILVQFTITYDAGLARTCYLDFYTNIYDIESKELLEYIISYANPFFSSALNRNLDFRKQITSLISRNIEAENLGLIAYDGTFFIAENTANRSICAAYNDLGEYNSLTLALNMPITAHIQAVNFLSGEQIDAYKSAIKQAKTNLKWSGVTEFISEPFTPSKSTWFVSVVADKTTSNLNHFMLTVWDSKMETIIDTIEFSNGKASTTYDLTRMFTVPSGTRQSYVVQIKSYGYTWDTSVLW